jgi:peptidoglycan/LPS O-acetylase OafA/YrhL
LTAPAKPAGVVQARPAAPRNSALDFSKGVLVFVMVLYHWLNYFIDVPYDVYRYLRFLTPSFIFITGFILSHVYLSKFDSRDPRLTKRLVQRGLKTLAIFVVLNLLIAFILPHRSSGGADPAPLRTFLSVYVAGTVSIAGDAKSASFFILVPIAYLLLLSAVLFRIAPTFRHVFLVVVALSWVVVAGLYWQGTESPNLELLAIGVLGIMLGYLPIARVNAWVDHWVVLLGAYAVYVAAIAAWNARYPLQVIGVGLTVALIYRMGQTPGEPGRVRSHLILAGQYSLVAYIAQIAILQVLHRIFTEPNAGVVLSALTLGGATLLTALSVEVLDIARTRSRSVDRLYRTVFA